MEENGVAARKKKTDGDLACSAKNYWVVTRKLRRVSGVCIKTDATCK